MKHFFPNILIALQLGAALSCAASRDFKMAVYWTAAAVLNIVVTY